MMAYDRLVSALVERGWPVETAIKDICKRWAKGQDSATMARQMGLR